MRVFHSLLAASIVLLTQVHNVQAVMVTGQGRQPANLDLTHTVERGGTVDAIDMDKRIIVVDGVTYPVTRATLKIHRPAGALSDKAFQLKPGMQIQFNTSGYSNSAKFQVYEIWVTSLGSNTHGK